MQLVSRKEAKGQGLKRYFTGNPCPKGHISERLTTSWACAECVKTNLSDWKIENPKLYSDLRHKLRKQWRRNNPIQAAGHSLTRRSRLQQATPKWLNQNQKDQFQQLLDSCPEDSFPDHIVPLAGITPEGYRVSGLHVPWNLQIMSLKENSNKGNRMTDQDYVNACSLVKELKV